MLSNPQFSKPCFGHFGGPLFLDSPHSKKLQFFRSLNIKQRSASNVPLSAQLEVLRVFCDCDFQMQVKNRSDFLGPKKLLSLAWKALRSFLATENR